MSAELQGSSGLVSRTETVGTKLSHAEKQQLQLVATVRKTTVSDLILEALAPVLAEGEGYAARLVQLAEVA
jgi:hypothetical protein